MNSISFINVYIRVLYICIIMKNRYFIYFYAVNI